MTLFRTLFVTGLIAAMHTAAEASVLGRVQSARSSVLPEAAPLSGEWYARQMLRTPDSPYSELETSPAFTNEIYWGLASADMAIPEDAALARFQVELGLTRARPGIDVTPRDGFRDPFVAAHATKAGLDPDIFWQVLDTHGYERAPRVATLALGLQLLREQALAIPAERQPALGVDARVFQRVMRARHAGEISGYDLRYLDALVQHRLLHPLRSVGLPVPWRIARIAAAFRDAQGYAVSPPCLRDGKPHPRDAGTGVDGDTRTPCLVAAHDRAVHRWYVDMLRRPPPSAEKPGGTLARIGALLATVMPLLDILAVAEVLEAAFADDLAAAGAVSRAEADAASERAWRITCRIPE